MNDRERLEKIKDRFSWVDDSDIEWLIERAEKLQQQQLEKIKELELENRKLTAFYDYFAELYGIGLEVANWHNNGDLLPFDNFFDSAEEEMGDAE